MVLFTGRRRRKEGVDTRSLRVGTTAIEEAVAVPLVGAGRVRAPCRERRASYVLFDPDDPWRATRARTRKPVPDASGANSE
jgi:hypothetical protein